MPSTDKPRPGGPPHRHAAPSNPWPWVDINDPEGHDEEDQDPDPLPAHECTVTCKCWQDYPQSKFPNWKKDQVRKSGIEQAISVICNCNIRLVDVDLGGGFTTPKSIETSTAGKAPEETWADILRYSKASYRYPPSFTPEQVLIHLKPEQVRVRAFFIENMSGQALQMLGACYNIEPFFFSSSLGEIPSRFKQEPLPGNGAGDHLTVIATFVRPVIRRKESTGASIAPSIDTLLPLRLTSTIAGDRPVNLVRDLLSIHIVRRKTGSIIISYHPASNSHNSHLKTAASLLQRRTRSAGDSVYWKSIFERSHDPTLIVLVLIWHAVCAWDEALELLSVHIQRQESDAIDAKKMSNPELTREFHILRAYLLDYGGLLKELRNTVSFIQDTRNPILEDLELSKKTLHDNIMKHECTNLLSSIKKLEEKRAVQSEKLENATNLVFNSVNIKDSEDLRKMTKAAIQDSTAMKQIAFLTMVFLPATFVASVFGMNTEEMSRDGKKTLTQYLESSLPLTFASVYAILVFQGRYILPRNSRRWMYFAWPIFRYGRFFGIDWQKRYPEDIKKAIMENDTRALMSGTSGDVEGASVAEVRPFVAGEEGEKKLEMIESTNGNMIPLPHLQQTA